MRYKLNRRHSLLNLDRRVTQNPVFKRLSCARRHANVTDMKQVFTCLQNMSRSRGRGEVQRQPCAFCSKKTLIYVLKAGWDCLCFVRLLFLKKVLFFSPGYDKMSALHLRDTVTCADNLFFHI